MNSIICVKILKIYFLIESYPDIINPSSTIEYLSVKFELFSEILCENIEMQKWLIILINFGKVILKQLVLDIMNFKSSGELKNVNKSIMWSLIHTIDNDIIPQCNIEQKKKRNLLLNSKKIDSNFFFFHYANWNQKKIF